MNELSKLPNIGKALEQQLLKVHLNPEYEGASRSFVFIDESANWIQELVSSTENPILDKNNFRRKNNEYQYLHHSSRNTYRLP